MALVEWRNAFVKLRKIRGDSVSNPVTCPSISLGAFTEYNH